MKSKLIKFYKTKRTELVIPIFLKKAENQISKVEEMRRISIKDIADNIHNLMDDEVTIQYISERLWDYEGKETSNEKIKRLLDIYLKINFEDGMKETNEWFEKNWF